MNRNHSFALILLLSSASLSTACAQTLLYSTGFTDLTGWVASGSMTFSRSNDQFLATGTYSTYFHPNDPWTTYGDAFHPMPTSGPLPDNQTLEARVDLVGVNQDDVWADLHVWGDPYAATYSFFKGLDGLALIKAWNWATSMACFFYENRAVKNTNVTLVLVLTRRGSNLEINTRILDKDNGNAVLFDRFVIDTPQADPVVPSGAFRGMLTSPDPAGTPPPVLRAPANVCLGVGWLNPTNGPQPAAQVVYDNVEVWQRPAPRPYVVAWGADYLGATFVPYGLSNVVAVAAGAGTSMALRSDGTIVSWGGDYFGQNYNTPPPLSNVVAIAAGGYIGFGDLDSHSLALRADGTVVLWGKDWDGTNCFCIPLSWVPDGLTNVVAVAAGCPHSVALRSDGTVAAWVSPEYGLDTNDVSALEAVPADLTNAVAIAAGGGCSLALRVDGTVVAWGSADQAVTNVPLGLSNVVAIAAGSSHCLALRSDGTLAAWGTYLIDGAYVPATVPPDLTNVAAIAAGPLHSLALRADGTMAAWGGSFMCGNWSPGTSIPAGLTTVMAMAGGSCHDLVLVGNGPPLTQARLTHPTLDANGFSVSVPTQSGRVYSLEYKNSLADAEWTRLPLVAGTGGERTLTDPTANGAQRFYRVRRW